MSPAATADPPAAERVEPALILAGPEAAGPEFTGRLGEALAGGRIAAVVLDPRTIPAERLGEALAATRAHTTALFLLEDAAAVIEAGADGLLLRAIERIEPARRLLGLERPIGVSTGGSRHDAMEAGEAGADWLLLGEGEPLARRVELVRWWSELFVLPCAAPADTAREASALLAAGADFLVPPATIWAAPSARLAPFREVLAAHHAKGSG